MKDKEVFDLLIDSMRSSEWMIIHLGESKILEHKILRVGDFIVNRSDAIVHLTQWGRFPEGTLLISKVRSKTASRPLVLREVSKGVLVPRKISEVVRIVNWSRFASLIRLRNKRAERIMDYRAALLEPLVSNSELLKK